MCMLYFKISLNDWEISSIQLKISLIHLKISEFKDIFNLFDSSKENSKKQTKQHSPAGNRKILDELFKF